MFLLALALQFLHRFEFFLTQPFTFLVLQPSLAFQIRYRHQVDEELLEQK